jgi:hypothetical protein
MYLNIGRKHFLVERHLNTVFFVWFILCHCWYLDYMASNGRMIFNLEWVIKEVVVA